MGSVLKKEAKARAKARKKEAKSRVKALKEKRKRGADVEVREGGKSHAVKFAEGVKGVIYLILAVSLAIALILSDQGKIVTLDDILGSLFLGLVGKIVVVVLAVAFFIYGLKRLGAVK